eukprot:gene24562-30924_t
MVSPTHAHKTSHFTPPPSTHHNHNHNAFSGLTSLDSIADFEMTEMAVEIRSLYGELAYVEQLRGVRSVLEDEEGTLEEAQLSAILEGPESEISSKVARKQIARALIQLVCRSMTYLLQSEVEKNELKERCEEVEKQLMMVMNNTSRFIGTYNPHSEYMASPQPAAAVYTAVGGAVQGGQIPVYSGVQSSPLTPHGVAMMTTPNTAVPANSRQQQVGFTSPAAYIQNQQNQSHAQNQQNQSHGESQLQTPLTPYIASAATTEQSLPPHVIHQLQQQSVVFTGASPTDYLFNPSISAGGSVAKQQTQQQAVNVMSTPSSHLNTALFTSPAPQVGSQQQTTPVVSGSFQRVGFDSLQTPIHTTTPTTQVTTQVSTPQFVPRMEQQYLAQQAVVQSANSTPVNHSQIVTESSISNTIASSVDNNSKNTNKQSAYAELALIAERLQEKADPNYSPSNSRDNNHHQASAGTPPTAVKSYEKPQQNQEQNQADTHPAESHSNADSDLSFDYEDHMRRLTYSSFEENMIRAEVDVENGSYDVPHKPSSSLGTALKAHKVTGNHVKVMSVPNVSHKPVMSTSVRRTSQSEQPVHPFKSVGELKVMSNLGVNNNSQNTPPQNTTSTASNTSRHFIKTTSNATSHFVPSVSVTVGVSRTFDARNGSY